MLSLLKSYRSVNATTRDFESTTTNMTFARLILAAANNDAIPRQESFQLPARSTAMTLVQYYLVNIFALFPIFSETALFNALDAVYQVNGRPVTEFEHWLLYMVLAIASTAQSRTSRDAFLCRRSGLGLVAPWVMQIRCLFQDMFLKYKR